MTQPLSPAAWIGLDWADQEHAVCLLLPSGAVEHATLVQDPAAIAAWVAGLRQRFGERPVPVALEQARGALVYALLQCPTLVLYPLNPQQLASYRKALHPSGAKDDPSDAGLLAQLLRTHQAQLRAWQPDDEVTRGLRLLVELRRQWVEERVERENQLLAWLKQSYVLALTLRGEDLHQPRFLALLKKFPTQRELQRASPRQLAQWLPRRRRTAEDPPAEELLRQRVAAIRAALPLTSDPAVIGAARLAVGQLVAALEQLNQSIADSERQITQLFAQHPDQALFASFPGAGAALAPRLAAAFGTDRQKFATAQELQQLSGIAPVMKRSGKTCTVHMRWACPQFLRQTFHEMARCSTKKSRWARAYLAMRKAQGHGYQESLRTLAFKWQRILFRCWQTRQPDDEERYLRNLQAKQSPILHYLDRLPTANT